MKYIPKGLARAIGKQTLVTKKNAPSLLFGAGVVGSVTSTVLACRSTLKLEATLDHIQEELAKPQRAVDAAASPTWTGDPFTEQDAKRATAVIYVRSTLEIVKLYAPAILVGGVAILCLTKSHHMLKERNVALAAAYTAVDEAFKKYRSKVIEKYGAEEDMLLRHDNEEVSVIDGETGEVITKLAPSSSAGSTQYARFFDEKSSSWNRENEYNVMFLTQTQNFFNDMLQVRGYVFLNDVYRALGIMPSNAGQSVGWISSAIAEQHGHKCDGFVDFGLQRDDPRVWDFQNGRENAILLDFNVDGPIFHMMDSLSAAQKRM